LEVAIIVVNVDFRQLGSESGLLDRRAVNNQPCLEAGL
jgi:hypothetical protein